MHVPDDWYFTRILIIWHGPTSVVWLVLFDIENEVLEGSVDKALVNDCYLNNSILV